MNNNDGIVNFDIYAIHCRSRTDAEGNTNRQIKFQNGNLFIYPMDARNLQLAITLKIEFRRVCAVCGGHRGVHCSSDVCRAMWTDRFKNQNRTKHARLETSGLEVRMSSRKKNERLQQHMCNDNCVSMGIAAGWRRINHIGILCMCAVAATVFPF